MNFHKKIGFLAALLLMFGLGVPDSFAQTVTPILTSVDVSPRTVNEGEATTVTITLAAHASSTTTVARVASVVFTLADGTEIGSTPVTIPPNMSEATAEYVLMAPEDDDVTGEVIQATASYPGYTSTTQFMWIVDDDKTISLSVDLEDATQTYLEGTEREVILTLNSLQSSHDAGNDVVTLTATPTTEDVTVTVNFPDEFVVVNTEFTEHVTVENNNYEAVIQSGQTEFNSGASNLKLIIDDNDRAEGDRMVEIVATTNAPGYSVVGTSGNRQSVTIIDDEQTLTLAIDRTEVTEGNPFDLVLDIGLRPAPGTPPPEVTLIALVDGVSIASNFDIDPPTIALTPTGDQTVTVALQVPDDVNDEDSGTRTAVVSLELGAGADKVTSNQVELTIFDDDQPLSIDLSVTPNELMEGGEGAVAVAVEFPYHLSGTTDPFGTTVALSATYRGIQIASTDIEIPAATRRVMGTLDIPLTDNDSNDGDRTIVVTASQGGVSATQNVVIRDNDGGPPPTGEFELSSNITSLRENAPGRNVEVTATLSEALAEGTTVMVTLTHAIMGDEVTPTAVSISGPITIVGPATTGTTMVEIAPSNDDVFANRSVVLTGSATGLGTASVSIGIIDDDSSMGTLSFSNINPPSVTMGGGAQNVTLTVKVVLATPDTPIPDALVVNVTADRGTLASDTVTITNTKKNPDGIPQNTKAAGTATVVLSLTAAQANAAGMITLTASADGYDMGTRTIPIRARDALDIAGYRAIIAKPTGTTWANVGNDKIFVDVTRFGSVAYPWSDFASIKVSIRDTAYADHEIEAVTASGFNLESNGSVTFSEPGSPSRGDVIWRGNDTIRFEIRVRGYSAARDTAANGQYMGAYAHVEFTSGSMAAIETRDANTSVYPADPSLVGDAKVGDGRLIRIDNKVPDHSGIAALRVTSGSEVGSAINATVGDEIRVAIATSQDKLFRESGLRIQLQVIDGSGMVNGQQLTAAQRNNPSKFKDFNTAQVIAAGSDSLRHTWEVTEGFFTVTLDDFVDGVGTKGTKLDLNNARAQVRAGKKDQAGNYKWGGWTKFNIDSRSPGVSILYPSAAPDSVYDHTHPLHFSGATNAVAGGQAVDEHLNPLAILVDEDVSALKVYAAGADTLDIFDQIPSDVAGNKNAIYDTQMLNSPKKDDDGNYVPSSNNRGGTEIDLVVLATDLLGNTSKTMISGVTHDASLPMITEWFPKNSLLPDDQINDATPPIFTLPEDVDSVAVTFTGSNGSVVTMGRSGVTTKGEESIDFSGALTNEISYDMTIFARDLAGNVYVTPADSSMNLKFNSAFDNPMANRYEVSASMDSVIAGQANMLTIQAQDYDGASDTARNALTYKNAARISAWDADGGAVASVWFEGTGVDDDADNPDGEAMLSADDWRIGKRMVTVKSNMAIGSLKILVQHLDSGMGDTAVVGFDGAVEGLYVGAADFAGFEITAWEDGVSTDEIWGDYTLRVVPVDRHGNPSARAFGADYDSLDVLDTRVGDSSAFDYKNGIDVEIAGVPSIEDFALLVLSIQKEGSSWDLLAPENRRFQTVQVRIMNESLKEGDTRSQNIRSSAKFSISMPLTTMLTLWVPGSDMDEAGNDVVIPADEGMIMVTVAAEGFGAGDMVTFTRNGMAMDPVAANSDGVAKLDITASVASTTTVSAMRSDGRYPTGELTIVFVDAPPMPARMSYVDANGDPVYLISDADMTVGTDDFLALVAAFGSSMGDDNYNPQADVNDDGMVNVDDYLLFIMSYGRTAVGPATKPLVLAPGVNENAEFTLSLGSARVVAGEMVAVDVSLANVAALVGYGFALNYESDKFEFVSVGPADEDLLKSTGAETLFHHDVSDGQVTVANGLYNGAAVSGGGDVVRFVFRVLREFEDNARFEIADGLVFDPSQLSNPVVVAGVLELQSTPREFALHQNFPNPFNPDTTIKYDLAESANVTLQIYNVLGQVVRTLVASEAQNAGRYQIRWNGMDDGGVSVSSGIYFYQISADGKFSDVRKLMLLK